MPYFKVDDHLHAHRKTLRAGVEAMGLWVLAASWSFGERTDGWVPDYVARRITPDAEALAGQLVRSGLWHEAERDGDTGWQFHEWDEWQHTSAYLAERNRRNANRMARKRAQDKAADLHKQAVRTHTADTAQEVFEPQPNPTQEHTPAADAASAFETFWTAYPRKVGKAAAAKAWAKATKATDAAAVMAGLSNAQQVWTTTGTEPRFIPHPATWLNQGRWADEVPLPDMPAQRPPTANQCDGTNCPGGRHEWTDARNRFMCMGV